MSEHLLTAVREGVATLTLNRPEARNAMRLGMHAALVECMVRIDGDQAVRCVVIRGADEHFHAGGDVKRFHAGLDDDDEVRYQTLPQQHPEHPSRHRLAAAGPRGRTWAAAPAGPESGSN